MRAHFCDHAGSGLSGPARGRGLSSALSGSQCVTPVIKNYNLHLKDDSFDLSGRWGLSILMRIRWKCPLLSWCRILDMSRLDISSCRRKSLRPGAWPWVVWGSALGARAMLPFLSLAQVGYSGRARCSYPDAASRAREEEPRRAAARRASPDGLITHPRAPTPRESPPAPTWAE
jgi:hypothetical protein